MSMLVAMLLSSITARGVINPVVVAAPAGANSALYLVLRNSSQGEDRLLRVTCSCAERIELPGVRGAGPDPDGGGVVMPPRWLVELRPGGARHLMLRRLRQPLVAGQTVAMTFHFARGEQTRDVRIVAEAEAGWAAGVAEVGPRRLGAMEPLAGWCWRGTFPGGRRTDTRCFSPIYGHFMQDAHRAGGEPASAAVRTLYSYAMMMGSTHFQSAGPDGVVRYGNVVPAGDGVTFEEYPQRAVEGPIVRTRWRRDGADAWQVVSEARRGPDWREQWRVRMIRAGRSPAF